jgi:hypothetical protein
MYPMRNGDRKRYGVIFRLKRRQGYCVGGTCISPLDDLGIEVLARAILSPSKPATVLSNMN